MQHPSPGTPLPPRPTLRGFVVAIRPFYLLGGLVLFALGALSAQGPRRPLSLALGAVVVALVHTIAHYVNDAEDVATDALARPTALTGGSRAIQRGLVSPSHLLGASAVLAALVTVISVVVALAGDVGSAALFMAILAGGYAYSGRPFSLGRRGLGELDTALVMGVLTPLAGAHAGGGISRQSAAVAAILALETVLARLCTAFADIDADRTTGKLTLPVLLGPRLTAVAYVVIAALVGALAVALLSWLPAPSLQLARAAVVMACSLAAAALIATGRADRSPMALPLLGVLAYGCSQTSLGAALAFAAR